MTKAKVKADPGTKRDERMKKALKGQDKKVAYLELKRRALEYEKDNYTQLVAIKTHEGNWWKLVGHSAIMYKYMVAPRLRLKPKLMPDTDYNVKSEEGVISISDIDRFEEKLKQGKIFRVKTTELTRIFDLGERVSEEDYVLMVNEDEMKLEMANKLIRPEERMSELNAKVKKMLEIIHPNVRKMEGVTRDVFGVEMEQKIVKLQLMVLRSARGTMEVEECLTEAFDIAEDLYGYVEVILNLRLMEPKIIYRMAEAIVALESQIKKELKKRAIIQAELELQNRLKTQAKLKKVNKTEGGKDNGNISESTEETDARGATGVAGDDKKDEEKTEVDGPAEDDNKASKTVTKRSKKVTKK